MRIPSFVPLEEKSRTLRSWIGLLIEILMWGYSFVVLGRIVVGQMVVSFVELFAYDEPPAQWAISFLESTGLDSRYPEFEWSSIGYLFLTGALCGAVVGLTGKGFGAWVSSLSRIQVSRPEDSIKVEKHWRYARKEGVWFFLLTLVTGWVVTKVDFARLADHEGALGFGRLTLQMFCGIPGTGESSFTLFGKEIINFGGSLFDILQWFYNLVLRGVNVIIGWTGSEPIQLFNIPCVPTIGEYYSLAISKLVESIFLAFMATIFSIPIAFTLSFFAARNLTRHSSFSRFIYSCLRAYMNITRSIEPIIWAILFSVWVGIGPFAGSIALMVHTISSLVKQYSEAVENVDEGPMEALHASGANRIAVVWYSVVPQVVLPYLAFTIYRWDINVRMATVIGLVGGGGIGGLLIQEQGLSHWVQVGTIAFLIFLVVWTMDMLSARIREAIQ